MARSARSRAGVTWGCARLPAVERSPQQQSTSHCHQEDLNLGAPGCNSAARAKSIEPGARTTRERRSAERPRGPFDHSPNQAGRSKGQGVVPERMFGTWQRLFHGTVSGWWLSPPETCIHARIGNQYKNDFTYTNHVMSFSQGLIAVALRPRAPSRMLSPGLAQDYGRLSIPNWGQLSVRGGRIPPFLMLPRNDGVLGSITPARKFRMLLHINPTRQRGKRTGSLARASGWYMTFFAAGVIG